jgi:hypothetical protein
VMAEVTKCRMVICHQRPVRPPPNLTPSPRRGGEPAVTVRSSGTRSAESARRCTWSASPRVSATDEIPLQLALPVIWAPPLDTFSRRSRPEVSDHKRQRGAL